MTRLDAIDSPALDGADPAALLDRAMRSAIASVLGDAAVAASIDPMVMPEQNAAFGDYQSNVAMRLTKLMAAQEPAAKPPPPREVANRLIEALPPETFGLIVKPEVAGPGFINFRLKPDALAYMLSAMDEPGLGVQKDADTRPVVIDLCGVNVAKQMHVGHLRSTIIGDALSHVLERTGRRVFRENHLGDWGLPIAMVLHQLRAAKINLDALHLEQLDSVYRDAQLSCKADVQGLVAAMNHHAGPHRVIELEEQNAGAIETLEAAKQSLVKLQQGDVELQRDWRKLIDVTMRAVYEALALMNVKLGPENNRGESFYRDKLAGVIEAYTKSGVATVDEGALVVRFADRERPLLIRKSDGGYLYATTDLAAVRYRVQELGGARVVYVVDARQRDHFKDVFDAIRLIGWDTLPDGSHAELIHVPFGAVLGGDKKPLKTRSGENITLMALLTEAVDRGTAEVEKRAADPLAPTHGLSKAELSSIGRAVGIGAVKYADLSNDLVRDYVFEWDRMIAFEGNTGPYVQYAHARVCSIFRKADIDPESLRNAAITISEPAEKALALLLLRYGQVVAATARTLEPHRLCTYLFDLANAYAVFYQQCPVLKAESKELMHSRLRLSDLTRRVLADGLGLLGIEAPPAM